MTVNRDFIDIIRESTGTAPTPGRFPGVDNDEDVEDDPGEPPYGYTIVGAINELDRIAEEIDEYDLALADLNTEKQQRFELAHEALQHHVGSLSNCLADGFVEKDDSLELPNGSVVDLPRAAIKSSSSKDLPENPAGGGL
jgi:hypothetical protein